METVISAPKIFAHRGVSSVCPENTIAAFEEAVRIGSDGIELDVHLSRDKKLVVCHDETLKRTTDGNGVIKDLTYKEILRFDAGAWFGSEFAGQKVPLLEDVLQLLRSTQMVLNIEMKTDYFPYEGIEEAVSDVVAEYGMNDRVIISSFNHYSILRLKRAAPSLQTGLLYNCHIYRPHEYAKNLPAEALHPAMHLTSPEIIADAKKAGYRVNVWFAGEKYDPSAARLNLTAGVDTLITNYPQNYLQLLREGSAP